MLVGRGDIVKGADATVASGALALRAEVPVPEWCEDGGDRMVSVPGVVQIGNMGDRINRADYRKLDVARPEFRT